MKRNEDAGPSVARYLSPEEAVVPFRERPELDELSRWCASGGHTSVRLVTGDGGAGKTRLALQFVGAVDAKKWRSMWLRRGDEPRGVEFVHTVGKPSVLVVDYAETRRELVALLNEAAADEAGPDLRVLLLARSRGEWWDQLLDSADGRAADLLLTFAPIALGSVPATRDVQDIFDDAVTAFARKMGTERPDATLVLSDPDPVVLVVHAAALVAVVDYATGARPRRQVVSGPDVLEAVLRHERRYWANSADSRSLGLDVSVLRLAVAAGCLIGAEDEMTASALLSRIPDLDTAERRGRVARWLHDLYPAHENDAQPREWLGPLRPDRLAEQLVADVLAQRSELIAPWFTDLDEGRAVRALTILARAALTQDRAVSLLHNALAADVDHLAVPALSVAVRTNPVLGEVLSRAVSEQPVSQETLRRIAQNSPSPSFALAAPAAVVLQRLADGCTDDSERAEWLMHLSSRLAALGRHEDALIAIEKATGIYRQLLPKAAISLNSQSMRLAELGRREEALAAIEEAVSIYRPLAMQRPDAYQPHLADILHTQSHRLAELGRREEALAAIKEAVSIYRQLAMQRPDVHRPRLAIALNSQSMRLADLGQYDEALTAIEEAVKICRSLADERPDAYRPDLADVLDTLSYRLAELGRRKEALDAIKEAISIYQPLANARPNAFLPDLAESLNSQSDRLGDLGRREEALDAIEQAAGIYRQLAEKRPDAFRPKLATSLNSQSMRLAELGRRQDALAAIEEAVSIHKLLAKKLPDAFQPDLAMALNSQSMRLADLGRHEEALTAIEGAVSIYQPLADALPGAFRPKLADILHTESYRLADLGRHEEALTAIEGAVSIYQPLADALPGPFQPKLAQALSSQSDRLQDLGRSEEALAVIEEAAGIYRQLAETRSDPFLPMLAISLSKLAGLLSMLNLNEEASAIRAELATTTSASDRGIPKSRPK